MEEAPAHWQLYFGGGDYEAACEGFRAHAVLAFGAAFVEEKDLLAPVKEYQSDVFSEAKLSEHFALNAVEVSYKEQLEPALEEAGLLATFLQHPDDCLRCLGLATYTVGPRSSPPAQELC